MNGEWQPIELADKEYIILGWCDWDCEIFRWNEDRYKIKPVPYWKSHRDVTTDRAHQPTHFMYLPDGPK